MAAAITLPMGAAIICGTAVAFTLAMWVAINYGSGRFDRSGGRES